MTAAHDRDIPAPEWIAFGDHRRQRVLYVPRSFSVGLLDTTSHAEVGQAIKALSPTGTDW